ncbi:MAG: hypothetical protein ACE5IR_26620, partial [bacterium]
TKVFQPSRMIAVSSIGIAVVVFILVKHCPQIFHLCLKFGELHCGLEYPNRLVLNLEVQQVFEEAALLLPNDLYLEIIFLQYTHPVL